LNSPQREQGRRRWAEFRRQCAVENQQKAWCKARDRRAPSRSRSSRASLTRRRRSRPWPTRSSLRRRREARTGELLHTHLAKSLSLPHFTHSRQSQVFAKAAHGHIHTHSCRIVVFFWKYTPCIREHPSLLPPLLRLHQVVHLPSCTSSRDPREGKQRLTPR